MAEHDMGGSSVSRGTQSRGDVSAKPSSPIHRKCINSQHILDEGCKYAEVKIFEAKREEEEEEKKEEEQAEEKAEVAEEEDEYSTGNYQVSNPLSGVCFDEGPLLLLENLSSRNIKLSRATSSTNYYDDDDDNDEDEDHDVRVYLG
uniref:Uncharacterized protein n=1 Tax=Vespula pensylvanica TaxID=30213 RepID=A0A834NSJ9_VESPE|nr:hypothetical protein H0235_011717 [Vespula pensylvanica]